MERKAVLAAISEAKRFIRRAEECLRVNGDADISSYRFPRESGACRRASLDLTRALADMRKS